MTTRLVAAVAILSGKFIMYSVTHKRKIGIQVGCSAVDRKEVGVQCSRSKGSYGRQKPEKEILTYDDLLQNYLWDKDFTFEWLKGEKMIARNRICEICKCDMKWVACSDRGDGYVWECRRQIGRKRHRTERSIRDGSWFEQANLSVEEVIKFSYWWCQGLQQWQIRQLGLGSHAVVDWDMFCLELCEVTIFENCEKLGGPRKVVQIDESKIGKRKYHRGHVVEGQWVFGGIEEDSRKCFIVTVENRSEETLVKHIQEWIEPGTTIVSDCWKGYVNLGKYGYVHETVNHSVEFVSPDGFDTNKIEGHWRQLKVNLPTHGRKKEHYSSYLAEFIWRYVHRGEDLFKVFVKDVASVYKFE